MIRTLLILMVTLSLPAASPAQTPPGDAYVCYKGALARGQAKFTPVQSTLEDKFRTLVANVKSVKSVCNPIEGATYPSVHPVGYGIGIAKQKPRQPKFEATNRTAIDRFGSHAITVVKPVELLVPSALVLGAGGANLVDTGGVSYFQCYKAVLQKGSKFVPPPPVAITDGFGATTLTLKKLTKLCTPVNANGDDVTAPQQTGHLLCYAAKLPKGTKFAPAAVSVNDADFGPRVLVAKGIAELCTPAFNVTAATPCSTAADCSPTGNACIAPTCGGVPPVCGVTFLDGTHAVEGQLPGDCGRIVCNGVGETVAVPDASDVPTTFSACLESACAGVPLRGTLTPAATGKDCTSDGELPKRVCGDTASPVAGRCVECNTNLDCPIPPGAVSATCSDHVCQAIQCEIPADCPATGNECIIPTCTGFPQVCGTAFVDDTRSLAAQTLGDCRRLVCDGTGNTVAVPDFSDVPLSTSVCRMPDCVGTPPAPILTSTATGTDCSSDGMLPKHVCGDVASPAAGTCVECNTNLDCPIPPGAVSATCSDHVCQAIQCEIPADCPATGNECIIPTCTGFPQVCGTAFVDATRSLAAQTLGDCRRLVCDGTGNTVAVPDFSDVPPSTSVCRMPDCVGTPPAPILTSTATGTDCSNDGMLPKHVCGDVASPAAGTCVECNTNADCTLPPNAIAASCSNHACVYTMHGSQTFDADPPNNYQGRRADFVVPAGVTSVTISAGGSKGALCPPQSKGGSITATIPVTGGETLAVFVGGLGNFPIGAPGFNGGGRGGAGTTQQGAGGGGASDVRQGGSELANRVVVAGGGGGGIGSGVGCGSGGGLAAGAGDGSAGFAGAGGTQSAGGAGGGNLVDCRGLAGSLGVGGNGHLSPNQPFFCATRGGGGGGGGYYGGGGGGAEGPSSGSGGGGSNFAVPTATNVTHGIGTSEFGQVTITW